MLLHKIKGIKPGKSLSYSMTVHVLIFTLAHGDAARVNLDT